MSSLLLFDARQHDNKYIVASEDHVSAPAAATLCLTRGVGVLRPKGGNTSIPTRDGLKAYSNGLSTEILVASNALQIQHFIEI